jgi:hypothetical protein
VQIKAEWNKQLWDRGAFGVRRFDAAFSALHFASGPLKAKGASPQAKAGKAASNRRTQNAPRSQISFDFKGL